MFQPELGGWQLGEDWLGESADPEVLAAKLTIEIVDNLQQEFPQLTLPLESGNRLTKWSGAELNRRHMDFQSIALPTELPDPMLESPCFPGFLN